MQQQQSESFLKIISTEQGREMQFTGQTEILLYSICNGLFATIAFLIFLYFVFRYMVKLSTESKDAREKQLEEGYINDPPPPYEEVVSGRRY